MFYRPNSVVGDIGSLFGVVLGSRVGLDVRVRLMLTLPLAVEGLSEMRRMRCRERSLKLAADTSVVRDAAGRSPTPINT